MSPPRAVPMQSPMAASGAAPTPSRPPTGSGGRLALAESAQRITQLGSLFEAAASVRAEEDLAHVLDDIADTVATALGLATVVVNLYRPAWDDFVVAAVHGSPDTCTALLGKVYQRELWTAVLDPRFERRGAYVIRHGEFDWESLEGARYVPPRQPAGAADAWHPEDELFVPFYAGDGHLLGIFSVGEPASGLRLSDEEIDVLVAVSRQAAIAVEGAHERAGAARHRRALEHLFTISHQLAGSLAVDAVLEQICEGVRQALDFGKVAVFLPGADGCLRPQAAAGWQLDDPSIQVPFTVADLERLMLAEHEREGCFLLPLAEVAARLELPEGVYRSQRNGCGPRAWNRHYLVVPLYDRDGAPQGLLIADEPADRLLPGRDRLQALRLFANQAMTALELARHFEHVRRLAEEDPLTRLLNRRTFVDRLDGELARCRAQGLPLALVFGDLDDFKAMNDARGHAWGDRALVRFAEALRAAQRVLGRVRARLRSTYDGAGALSGSFGAAVAAAGEGAEELLRRADELVYAAKRAGRLRPAA